MDFILIILHRVKNPKKYAKNSKKLFVAMASAAATNAQAKVSDLGRSDYIVVKAENAAQLGLDFETIKELAYSAGLTSAENSDQETFLLRFHEETHEVDLSSFDGVSVTVDVELLGDHPENFKE